MNFLSNWLAKITKSGNESGSFPIQQFEMNGRVGDAYIASPYGVHANLPAEQPALNMSPDGTILMGIDPIGRIKVESGEVVFYHPGTKSKIHFKSNADIDVIASSNVNITAPNVNITGNVSITGDLSVTGATALSDTVTSNGKDISDTHGHSQGNDSANDSQVDTDGVV